MSGINISGGTFNVNSGNVDNSVVIHGDVNGEVVAGYMNTVNNFNWEAIQSELDSVSQKAGEISDSAERAEVESKVDELKTAAANKDSTSFKNTLKNIGKATASFISEIAKSVAIQVLPSLVKKYWGI